MAIEADEHEKVLVDEPTFRKVFEKHGYPEAFITDLWESRPTEKLCMTCLQLTAKEMAYTIPEIESSYAPAVKH